MYRANQRSLMIFLGRSVSIVLLMVCPGTLADQYDFKHGISYLHELKYPADFAHFENLNPDAPKGGTLVLASMTSFDTLAPMDPSGIWHGSTEAPGTQYLYDSLLLRSEDELDAFYGNLAESVAIAADRRSIAFRMRPEARWHDGVPVTGEDVKFTFEALAGTPAGKAFLHWIGEIELVSDREFIVHTTNDPYANLQFFGFVDILPAHIWSNKDATRSSLDPPIGSGPYRVTDVKKGQYIEYTRDPDFWGRNVPGNRGKYNFEQIRYDVYRDAGVAREAFRKGLFDVWRENDVRHWRESYDIPAKDRGWLVQHVRGNPRISGASSVLILNNQRPPFDDIRVREALVYALDFDWQNRVLHGDAFTRATSYFHNSIFAATGMPSEAELELLLPYRDQLPPQVFDEPFSLPGSDGIGYDRNGLMHARDILKSAGWRIDDGKLVNEEGEPFTIELLSRSPTEHRILLPYINTLSMLGIVGKIRTVDDIQFVNRMRKRDYDAHLIEYSMEVPPLILDLTFHSDAIDAPINQNHAAINNPVTDWLVEATASATTLDSLVTACRALDRVLLWNFHQIPLNAATGPRVVYWDKFSRPEDDETFPAPYPDSWWFDDKKASRIRLAVSQ